MKKREDIQFIEAEIKKIEETVGSARAMVACSGGVDSVVTAVLAHRAIGSQLEVFMIDTGLMREGECRAVRISLEKLGLKITVVDEGDSFFTHLQGITNPEEKRRVFRDTFYNVLGGFCRSMIPLIQYFLQGTKRADVKETVGRVKTHHNVLGQIGIDPTKYGLPANVIEPLKDLYKDKIREMAKALNLPPAIYERMPFPGPGLAIRVMGEVTREKVAMVRKATLIVEDELTGLQPFQVFAALLSDKATGIRDGQPFWGDIVAIRSVHSENALTAQVTEVPWVLLNRVREKILTKIPSVARVMFDLTPKEPGTIEYM